MNFLSQFALLLGLEIVIQIGWNLFEFQLMVWTFKKLYFHENHKMSISGTWVIVILEHLCLKIMELYLGKNDGI